VIFRRKQQDRLIPGFNPGLAFSFFETKILTYSLGIDFQLVAKSDPQRVYLGFFRAEFLAIADIHLTFGQAGANAPYFAYSNNYANVFFWGESGPLCGQDWYAKTNGGAVSLSVIEVRYAPANN